MLRAITKNFQVSVSDATSFSPAAQRWAGWREAGGSSTPQALPLPGVLWLLVTNEPGGLSQKTSGAVQRDLPAAALYHMASPWGRWGLWKGCLQHDIGDKKETVRWLVRVLIQQCVVNEKIANIERDWTPQMWGWWRPFSRRPIKYRLIGELPTKNHVLHG